MDKFGRFSSFILENAELNDAISFIVGLGVDKGNIEVFDKLGIQDVRLLKEKSEVAHSKKIAFLFGHIWFDAQNALLKLIEEPPEKTIFVFYKPDILLDTVRSRCQLVKFRKKEYNLPERMREAIDKEDENCIFEVLLDFENESKNDIEMMLNGLMLHMIDNGRMKVADKLAEFIKDFKDFNMNRRLLLVNAYIALRRKDESSYC